VNPSKLSWLLDRHRLRLLVKLLERPASDCEIRIPDDVEVEEFEVDVLRIEMYHRHLPRLEQAGLIEWDPTENTVTRGPEFDEIRPLLELLRERPDAFPTEPGGYDGIRQRG